MITFDTNISSQNATTQYLDFDYNSMAQFGDKFLCASEAGLFEIINSGDNVESYFEIATIDCGISNEKRLRSVYIGYEASGDLTLILSTELGCSGTYVIPASSPGQHGRKIPISRSLRGKYWVFQIYSNGVPFSIDEIRILPIVRGQVV